MIYLYLMKVQHMARTAIKENDFNMRINSWEVLLPYYFALNMFNYARYGSFYLETLKNIEYNYPGLKPPVKIMKKLILVTLGSLCHIKSCCWLSDVESLLPANVCDVQTILKNMCRVTTLLKYKI